MRKLSLPAGVLLGGLLGGALDLVYAISFAATLGVTPVRVLQTIASGLQGADAYDGGNASAALGLFCHFAISVGWAGIYAAVAMRIGWFRERPMWTGPLFGIVVFLAMRCVVLPLSAYPRPVSFPPLSSSLDLLSHMFLFGLPIALLVARALRR
ncbi:DUF1440 domain-containing protein [Marilutibacter chinensis]|uniref:DUF1440 domain-containing protein n=1 Tax=Marilutibacter chinensis TaxID=2912247 RepID=A0ABS9HVM9_9GAMM|nr:DUF1440 domain-containing protein [Lysobacter chinensis]MCF7222758.1 DUF1440 domain-containing protein [Lysobacter chinensis]